jgi:hypothetical protein
MQLPKEETSSTKVSKMSYNKRRKDNSSTKETISGALKMVEENKSPCLMRGKI